LELSLARILDTSKRSGFHHHLVVLLSFVQLVTSDLLLLLRRLFLFLTAPLRFSFFSGNRRYLPSSILHFVLHDIPFLFLFWKTTHFESSCYKTRETT